MNSQTSLVAKNYRLQQWAAQIQDCQNRPKDMSVGDWCLQHNITKANYYYRLKCVRQACLDAIPEMQTGFVELPAPEQTTIVPEIVSASAVIRTKTGVAVELRESASSDFILKILGAVSRAE